MKKLLFIPFLFLIFLLGCKGGPGDTPDGPGQFDIKKINLNYSMDSQYSDYQGLELYKKISDGNYHYLFYIRNHINGSITVYYDKDYLGFIRDPRDDYDSYKETLNEKYFNLAFNLEEPETFSDYSSYEFEIKNNKIIFIILPTVKLTSNFYKYFIDSDEYPLFFSNNENNIEIGFNFEENIFKENCVDGKYNFTDFKDLSNMRYCYPRTFLYGTDSYIGEERDYITTILYDIKTSDKDFKTSYKKLIGLEYEYDSGLYFDYELMERSIEYNEDPSECSFTNSDYSIERHNFIKNHGTVYNVSCDKFNFKYFENNNQYSNYLCLNAKLKNIELYELYNNKYTSIILSKEDFKSLYDYIDNKGLNISINDIEFSPFENKIIGCRFYEYCY